MIFVDINIGEVSENEPMHGKDILKINNKEYNHKSKKFEKIKDFCVVYSDKGKFNVPESYNVSEIIGLYNEQFNKQNEDTSWF